MVAVVVGRRNLNKRRNFFPSPEWGWKVRVCVCAGVHVHVQKQKPHYMQCVTIGVWQSPVTCTSCSLSLSRPPIRCGLSSFLFQSSALRHRVFCFVTPDRLLGTFAWSINWQLPLIHLVYPPTYTHIHVKAKSKTTTTTTFTRLAPFQHVAQFLKEEEEETVSLSRAKQRNNGKTGAMQSFFWYTLNQILHNRASHSVLCVVRTHYQPHHHLHLH